MIVTLDAKCRVSLPDALVPATPGDQFDAEDDVIVLRRVKRKSDWLSVWKQCPVPMDDLPPRSRELPKKLSHELTAGRRRDLPANQDARCAGGD